MAARSMRTIAWLILRGHLCLLAWFLPDASKIVSLHRLLALLTPSAPFRPYECFTEREIVHLVQAKLAHPWRMRGRRCLREGVLCFHLLRLANVPAELHFGVFAEARGRELAHCWVVVGGRSVTSPPQDAYALVLTHGVATS